MPIARKNHLAAYEVVDHIQRSSHSGHPTLVAYRGNHHIATFQYNVSCCGEMTLHYLNWDEAHYDKDVDYFADLWNWLSQFGMGGAPTGEDALGGRRSMLRTTLPITGNADGTTAMQKFVNWMHKHHPDKIDISRPIKNPNSGRWLVTVTFDCSGVEYSKHPKKTCWSWFDWDQLTNLQQ